MRYFCSESKNSQLIIGRFIEMCEANEQVFLTGPKGSEFNLLLKEYCASFETDPSVLLTLQVTMMEESTVNEALEIVGKKQRPSIVVIETRGNFDEISEKRLLRFLDNPPIRNMRYIILLEDFDPFDPGSSYSPAIVERAKESLFMVPPLKERLADVSFFATEILGGSDQSIHIAQPLKFAKDAIELMLSYSWPGNYEELAGAMRVLAVGGAKNGIISRARLEETINLSRTKPI